MNEMRNFLRRVLVTLISLLILVNFLIWGLFGGTISNKDMNEALKKNVSLGVEINEYSNNTVINIGKLPFISKTPFYPISIFKYYVNNVGVLSRFSSSSEYIDELYKKNEIPDSLLTKRKRLGLK